MASTLVGYSMSNPLYKHTHTYTHTHIHTHTHIYIYIVIQRDCFVVSQLFIGARTTRCFKPKLKFG